MLTAAYHMLKNGVEYHDLDAEHFTRRNKSKAIQRLVRRLTELGCEVQVNAQAA
jgi:transposase